MSKNSSILPNVIVPGGQKCGSSSLAHYLSLHPDCCISQPKEPTFLSLHRNLISPETYGNYFKEYTGQSVIFEASTAYLVEHYAPDRIRRVLGCPKIVIILRNPASRAISAYLHLKNRLHDFRGMSEVFADLPETPEEAWIEEERRLIDAIAAQKVEYSRYYDRYDDFLWPYRYAKNSWYPMQVERYLSTFGKQNVYILFLEDLQADSASSMAAVFEFLELAPFTHEDFQVRKNVTSLRETVSAWNPLPHNRVERAKAKLRKLLPQRQDEWAIEKQNEERNAIRRSLHALLSSQYQDLSAMTGLRVPDAWHEIATH